MLVTELGMVTDVRPVQFLKASIWISVTESERVIEVSPRQLWKADCPMMVTELGIVSEPDSPLQPQKAYLGIRVTLDPIFRVVKLVQSRNAALPLSPMIVQFVALKLTVVSPLQP